MFGSLAGGIVQGMQARQQAGVDKEERDLRKQMIKLQLANAKIAQQQNELRSNIINTFLPQFAGGGQEQPQTAPAQDAPGLVDQMVSSMSPMSPGPDAAPPAPAQMSQGSGLLDRLASMDPMQAAILKEISGIDFMGARRDSQPKMDEANLILRAQSGDQQAQAILDAKADRAPTETGLIRLSLGSGPRAEEAKLMLDMMSQRKKETAAAGATQVNVNTKRQSAVVESFIQQLPEAYKEAVGDKSAIERIDASLDIVNRGGDSVTGLSGAIKSALAPYATAIGMNTDAMNDAQILQTLLDAGAGSLRLEVVGPGPVSNFEQQILQKVSGRKMSAAEGVKAILNYHRSSKVAKLKSLNERLDNASKVEGYEDVQSIYPKIEYSSGQRNPAALDPNAEAERLIQKYGRPQK